MNGINEIVKSLESSSLLLKEVSKEIQKQKKQSWRMDYKSWLWKQKSSKNSSKKQN